MYNLDQLLSYLVFIAVITFIVERIIENLLMPLLPPVPKKGEHPDQNIAKIVAFRTYLTLLLTFAFGFGLALANPRFRLLAGGLGMETAPLIDSLFTAALMAGGSQPLHSIIEQARTKKK
ncbi:MAG TPA: hypothetical protein GXX33_05740 [Firmicutes bacterium]|uniref:Uncharacterized protein n=1 Tax=Capillibacterium thermochitinicola TaxID=2699427 RepID=A0A8J6I0C0_9FIRM|nr:hypothetical protein [Capillibacterium thermochitinicola]MBA2133275.1 hypothetical protein [Capillibacterium thermochitinicola]HHW12486.1 hypothetical protein [Bacillota bacterium]